MERFACSTAVVSGEGAISALGEEKARRLLLITEPRFAQPEQERRIVSAAGNPETERLDCLEPEPTMKQAVEGSRRIKAFLPELVVAFGGEKVLSSAKAMVCFSGHNCVLAAVPAVPGSGGEVTGNVILTHDHRRHFFRDRKMRPDLAVLDRGLMAEQSRMETAENGFELLAVSMEAYASVMTGMITGIHAREAFSAAWGALPAAFAGSKAARGKLQTASLLAGIAGGCTEPGLCHALQNSLGSIFGLSRGKLAGILLPAIIGCNAHAAAGRYAELARAAGMGGSREEIGIRNLRTGLIRLRRELGLPGTLVQAGVDIRTVWNCGKRVVEMTLEDAGCRNNPVAVDDFMVRRILEEITGRL